ncbi:MAG: peptidylprolyl isomerase [Pseudomonadota bacterium]
MKHTTLTTLIIALLGTNSPILAQDKPGQPLDRIIAVADDGVVLSSELDAQMNTIRQRLRADGIRFDETDLRKQVLDSLILKRIQLQMAEARGIRVADTQLNQALDRLARQNGLTLLQLPGALAADGIDYATFREELRQEIIISQLTQREVARTINVTEKEVDDMLAKQNDLDNREYNLGHILISVASDAPLAQVEELRGKAQDILDRLRDGEDFAQMAVAYSNGQQALNGGSLGWRQSSEVPTLFSEHVQKLGSGELSELIRSSSGYHIIKVHEVRGGEKVMLDQYRARHILIRTDEITTDEQAERILTEFRQRIDEGEDFGDIARRESDDPGSALQGGDLGWARADIYAPAFAEKLVGLTPGQLSEPFKSQFGWHLLELMETREYDATQDALRNRAVNALRRRKMEEGTQLWLQRIRDQAYIEMRI